MSSFYPEKARLPPSLQTPDPPITKFKIGLCQLKVTADKERNIRGARSSIEEAVAKGAKLVVLPEIWNSPYSNESFPLYAEDVDAGFDASPSTAMLSDAARRLKVTIIGGSIPECKGDKLYNTCCVFGPDGELKAKHRKIHLFDVDIPGKITFNESKTLTAGHTPTIVDTEVGRIGIGICYDINFQELAVLYAARDSDFTVEISDKTNNGFRPKHDSHHHEKSSAKYFLPFHFIYEFEWTRRCPPTFHFRCSIDLLSRSIRNEYRTFALGTTATGEIYVATCSPARDVTAGFVAWGHSTLVSPFGEVLATTDEKESIVISEIDYSQIELRRTNLPLEKQRRGDLYRFVDVPRLECC